MKRKIAFLIIAVIAISGFTETTSKKVVLDLGTLNFLLPEYLNGKVKVVKETPFEVNIENGEFTKGIRATSKVLADLNFASDFNAYFYDFGLVSKFEYLNDGKVASYWVSETSKGQYSGTKYFKNDTLLSYGQFRYNDKGCLEETSSFYSKTDSILGRYSFKNDNNCNYIEYRFFNQKGISLNRHEIIRDISGRVVERNVYNAKDSLVFKKVSAYNEKGFCILEDVKSIKYGDAKYTYKYLTYDNYENWLTVIVLKNDKPVLFVERTYEYY